MGPVHSPYFDHVSRRVMIRLGRYELLRRVVTITVLEHEIIPVVEADTTAFLSAWRMVTLG